MSENKNEGLINSLFGYPVFLHELSEDYSIKIEFKDFSFWIPTKDEDYYKNQKED